MPPRLPRRSEMEAGRAGEFGGVGGYKDFAPDGAAYRRGGATNACVAALLCFSSINTSIPALTTRPV
jgi:hypothetical protein